MSPELNWFKAAYDCFQIALAQITVYVFNKLLIYSQWRFFLPGTKVYSDAAFRLYGTSLGICLPWDFYLKRKPTFTFLLLFLCFCGCCLLSFVTHSNATFCMKYACIVCILWWCESNLISPQMRWMPPWHCLQLWQIHQSKQHGSQIWSCPSDKGGSATVPRSDAQKSRYVIMKLQSAKRFKLIDLLCSEISVQDSVPKKSRVPAQQIYCLPHSRSLWERFPSLSAWSMRSAWTKTRGPWS